MPMNRADYPPDWEERRKRILTRAGSPDGGPHGAKCEECERPNYSANPVTGSRVVLTIAHLDHDPSNWNVLDDRLRAMCQKCHNNYDAEHRAKTRRLNYIGDCEEQGELWID